MGSSILPKLACAVVVCIIVMGLPHHGNAAIDCGQVVRNLAPCLNYLKGGPGPGGPCCSGIATLNRLAVTPVDRRTACSCLKSTAGSVPGVNYNIGAGLPSKCGVSIPYSISVNTDCSKVH